MTLSNRIEQSKDKDKEEEEKKIEVVFIDEPMTEGQKWFKEKAERALDELK